MLWPRSQPDVELPAQPATAGSEPDDARLVAAAQADPRAFAALYERYLDRVYRYCYLRLGSSEAAEDATSDIFLKAFAALSTFHGDVFAAWLLRIAHNVVVDRHRRHHWTEPLDATGDVHDPVRTPEEQAIASDEQEALRTALAGLPTDQRAVLELQLAGWNGEEIAQLLGKSPGAVKMLRFRAMGRLREVLRSDTAPGMTEAHDA